MHEKTRSFAAPTWSFFFFYASQRIKIVKPFPWNNLCYLVLRLGLEKDIYVFFFFLVFHSFQGYLPSVVLKRIILESKTPLEKNLDAKIVTVKEIGWDQPNPSPVKPSSASSSIIRTITVQPTTRQTHYPGFLPYVLAGLCLLAGLIVIVAFYR